MNEVINPLVLEKSSNNSKDLLSPKDLVTENRKLNNQLESKVQEVKELFIKYKLNEEDSGYQRAYERSTHELDDIKKSKVDFNNDVVKMNNILSLKLYNIDEELNVKLRKSNKLRTRIDNEDNEINSFEQMKEDETIEYRLNIYYMIGLFLGGGFLIRQITNYSIKK